MAGSRRWNGGSGVYSGTAQTDSVDMRIQNSTTCQHLLQTSDRGKQRFDKRPRKDRCRGPEIASPVQRPLAAGTISKTSACQMTSPMYVAVSKQNSVVRQACPIVIEAPGGQSL